MAEMAQIFSAYPVRQLAGPAKMAVWAIIEKEIFYA